MNRFIFIDKDGNQTDTYYPACLFDNGTKSNDGVYSDRLFQWDSKLHDELCQKYFGNAGQCWGGREPEKIEAFLRDYTKNPGLVLCRIEEYENKSSGYPYWRFDFKK